MNDHRDLGAIARAIIDSNRYMVLGTADANGRPWVSPVYYAPARYRHFYWVSSQEATHSRNIATRPQMSIVIFDSQVAVGDAQAVYMAAVAEQLTDMDVAEGIDIFSRRSQEHGAREWSIGDVQPPALLRLYRARATQHSVLDPAGHPVHGRAIDHRASVSL
jgi:general stress protein 26